MKLSDETELNLSRLVVTRMLLQANSGGGKSWALRRILEQSHGEVQQIVIDVDDEFYTLREKFDYVLVRKEGGDCVPEVRSADLLAHRLLELGVSAIVSIYEMKAHERVAFVKHFLEALINAPKKLWHPALIVVDEAHVFCPEQEKAESASAVIELMSRGRKRGFCGLLATQRISKLNKDAAAEANNKLIGRAALDVDMKRAAEELGFASKEDKLSLRMLKPGEFFGFGPAISDIVIPVKVGPVQTTHPKAGAGVTPVAPPKHKVQSVLAKLADLPQEAEAERASIASLQSQVRELKRENGELRKATPKDRVETKVVEKFVLKDSQITRIERWADRMEKFYSNVREIISQKFVELQIEGVNAIAPVREAVSKVESPNELPNNTLTRAVVAHAPAAAPRQQTVPTKQPASGSTGAAGGEVTGGLRRILIALAQRPNGLTKGQIGVRAGLSSKGGSFSTYLSRGRSNQWLLDTGGRLFVTEEGVAALGDFEMLPSGEGLYQHWSRELGEGGAGRILRVLFEAYPGELSKQEVAERAGISAAGGSFSTYLSRLRSLELITGKAALKASEEFFEG